jgi:hypothetical protein
MKYHRHAPFEEPILQRQPAGLTGSRWRSLTLLTERVTKRAVVGGRSCVKDHLDEQ